MFNNLLFKTFFFEHELLVEFFIVYKNKSFFFIKMLKGKNYNLWKGIYLGKN